MAVDRQFGKIVFVCDTCDTRFEGASGETFEAVWEQAKIEGWRTRKIAGEWLHGCPQAGCEVT
jgi:hypothetical protein